MHLECIFHNFKSKNKVLEGMPHTVVFVSKKRTSLDTSRKPIEAQTQEINKFVSKSLEEFKILISN